MTITEHNARPADPAAFIAEAERITNTRSLHALEEIFAPTATWTVLIDGLRFAAVGHHEIQFRWAELCRFMTRRGLTVAKNVIACDDRTIVSGWTGHTNDGATPTGHEIWRFDSHGRVCDQLLAGYLAPKPAESLVANLRYLCHQPANALAFAAARLTPRNNNA